jgi:hypothetical protein
MEERQMTDADKIEYLEGRMVTLSAQIETYKKAWEYQNSKVKQLETELAAAKASNPTTRAVHDVAELYKDQPTAETNP